MAPENTFDLEEYLTGGVENLVRDLVKSALFHPAESRFMARYAVESKKASQRRHLYEQQGEHIPPFLIASITSLCNLHCAGCYARSLDTCADGEPVQQLTAEEWGGIFSQARELGISFILLAGGEPMVRRDVLEKAAEFPEILFPVFTNGTLFGKEYLALLEKNRNIAPIFSIEGGQDSTDIRRGLGVYKRVRAAMEELSARHILFGASITVTRENWQEVTSDSFIQGLQDGGCKAIIYVEYVPTEHELGSLALDDALRAALDARLTELREREDMPLMISFPGDEQKSGGCLAAGRGFFHINSHGGAEPCPFSPYSDVNVRDTSLRQAMASRLFTALRDGGMLLEEHEGGCTLFARRAEVEALLQR